MANRKTKNPPLYILSTVLMLVSNSVLAQNIKQTDADKLVDYFNCKFIELVIAKSADSSRSHAQYTQTCVCNTQNPPSAGEIQGFVAKQKLIAAFNLSKEINTVKAAYKNTNPSKDEFIDLLTNQVYNNPDAYPIVKILGNKGSEYIGNFQNEIKNELTNHLYPNNPTPNQDTTSATLPHPTVEPNKNPNTPPATETSSINQFLKSIRIIDYALMALTLLLFIIVLVQSESIATLKKRISRHRKEIEDVKDQIEDELTTLRSQYKDTESRIKYTLQEQNDAVSNLQEDVQTLKYKHQIPNPK